MRTRILLNEPCPICKSENTVGHGTSISKKSGSRRRRLCKDCASTFFASNNDDKDGDKI